MANISFFYPERDKGFALGLNAAGGNLGVALTAAHRPRHRRRCRPHRERCPPHLDEVLLVYAGGPLCGRGPLASVAAWCSMNSLATATVVAAAPSSRLRAADRPGVMSVLYIGTFGSFIGYCAALPLIIKTTFPEFLPSTRSSPPTSPASASSEPLIGSRCAPSRRLDGGPDGGARVTLACFLAMGVVTRRSCRGGWPWQSPTHACFARSSPATWGIFVPSGVGNGSTLPDDPRFADLARHRAEVAGADGRPADHTGRPPSVSSGRSAPTAASWSSARSASEPPIGDRSDIAEALCAYPAFSPLGRHLVLLASRLTRVPTWRLWPGVPSPAPGRGERRRPRRRPTARTARCSAA